MSGGVRFATEGLEKVYAGMITLLAVQDALHCLAEAMD